MTEKDPATRLKDAIEQLELRQAREWLSLKEQFLDTYESLKPLNVLKNTWKEVSTSPDIKENVLGTTLGLTVGHLARSLFVGASQQPLKKILGTLLQAGVSNVVASNSGLLKSLIGNTVSFFTKEKSTTKVNHNGNVV
jgi:hypothetical protein